MNVKELEGALKLHTDGAMFIRPGELAKFLGESKTERVKKYCVNAFKLEDSKRYFIPDVARNIFYSGDFR